MRQIKDMYGHDSSQSKSDSVSSNSVMQIVDKIRKGTHGRRQKLRSQVRELVRVCHTHFRNADAASAQSRNSTLEAVRCTTSKADKQTTQLSVSASLSAAALATAAGMASASPDDAGSNAAQDADVESTASSVSIAETGADAAPVATADEEMGESQTTEQTDESASSDVMRIHPQRSKQDVAQGVYNRQSYAHVQLCSKLRQELGTDSLTMHEILDNKSCFFLSYCVAVFKACSFEFLERLSEPFKTRLRQVWQYGETNATNGGDPSSRLFRASLADYVLTEAPDDLERAIKLSGELEMPSTTRSGVKPNWRNILAHNLRNKDFYFDESVREVLMCFLPIVKVFILISDGHLESCTFFHSELMNIFPPTPDQMPSLPLALHFINPIQGGSPIRKISKRSKADSSDNNHYEPLLNITWELIMNQTEYRHTAADAASAEVWIACCSFAYLSFLTLFLRRVSHRCRLRRRHLLRSPRKVRAHTHFPHTFRSPAPSPQALSNFPAM
jgi:hypothetical protein